MVCTPEDIESLQEILGAEITSMYSISRSRTVWAFINNASDSLIIKALTWFDGKMLIVPHCANPFIISLIEKESAK